MRDIPIFIASSVREFKSARRDIAEVMERLNRVYKKRGVEWIWNRPETESRMLNIGGSQLTYDEYIRQSEVFVLIIGQRVGFYTKHEYEVALEQYAKTGKPKILPCFLDCASDEAETFRKKIQRAEIGVQFVDYYENLADIKSQIQWELINYETETADLSYDEAQADAAIAKAKKWAAGKVHSLQEEISTLNERDISLDVIAEITRQYAEMARIVRKYEVEPDVLLEYVDFLRRQHFYRVGINIGRWIEGFYSMERPNDCMLSSLKTLLGLCYEDNNRYEQAERYYREALEINQRLAMEDSDYEPGVALSKGNLGNLFFKTNRMEDAETHYEESLEIWRRLAKIYPAEFEPYVAATYNNLGGLFRAMNRTEDAKTHYKKALEIRRRLAKDIPDVFEPDVAMTCNNLAILLKKTNRMEDAEIYYREALEIYKRLAKANPNAFAPNVANTHNNLAVLLEEMNRIEEAERYYREALDFRMFLAKENPTAFAPDVAATCSNLATLFYRTNRMEEAEESFRTALKIYRLLSEENYPAFAPYVALACNNLGLLLFDTSRMEESETYYREALKIRRRLVEANPATFEPDLATTCYSLGLFERERENLDAARQYFEKALSLYEKFPHLAHYAQMCRDRLAEL